MKIDWNLSDNLLLKVKRIEKLREEGKTWEQISAIIGNHRTYLITLYSHYKGGSQ